MLAVTERTQPAILAQRDRDMQREKAVVLTNEIVTVRPKNGEGATTGRICSIDRAGYVLLCGEDGGRHPSSIRPDGLYLARLEQIEERQPT